MRTSPKRSLLLVDDSPVVLKALQQQLENEGYEILTACNAREALDILSKHVIGVVVTDQEMPGMPGTELLHRIRKSHPQTVRILLTASSDITAVTHAVNEGAVYKYFTKPWKPEKLLSDLREAFHFHELLLEKEQLDREMRRTNMELRQINEALQKRLSNQSRQLVKASQYDPVTNLPNRLLLTDRLKQAIVRARSENTMISIFVIGLDRFVLINETLGQAAGDQLLHAVAERLTACVRERDTVARFGGDEFIIMMTGLRSIEEVNAMLDIARPALAEPFSLRDDSEIFISASIGISIYPYDGANDEELIKHAYTAMHHAKQLGEGNYKFYTEEMNVAAIEWLKLENDLRHALRRNEFHLHYQPQYTIAGDRVASIEALIRWQHPQRGLISPAEFLPILEKTGLIIPVGEWVFRESCRQFLEWRRNGLDIGAISINLSVRQFNSASLLAMMDDTIRELGLDTRRFEVRLEVTEHMVIEDFETTLKLLQQIRDRGFHIAVDDFGTGYASLHYLTRFPVSSLKIDRSFISRLGSSENDANLVRAIIAMARSLGLRVTAEGVETQEQLAFLRDHQCDEVQGYLLSPPCPAGEIPQLLGSDLSRVQHQN